MAELSYKEALEFNSNPELAELRSIMGKPTVYKGIKIYPVKVKDMIPFNTTIGLLTINKNETGNLEAIRMSYLDYLIGIFIQDPSFLKGFNIILNITLNATNMYVSAGDVNFYFNEPYINSDGEKIENGYLQSYVLYTQYYDTKARRKIHFTIGDKQYSLSFVQFDQLRKKICEVNNIPLSEEILPEKIRVALEKAKKYQQREKGLSLGQTIVALASLENNNDNIEAYLNMTISHFSEAVKRHDVIQESVFEGIARRTGLVEIKEPLTWLFDYKAKESATSGLVTKTSGLEKMAQAIQ